MPQPGSLDFTKLAAQATAQLEGQPAEAVKETEKIEVAQTEKVQPTIVEEKQKTEAQEQVPAKVESTETVDPNQKKDDFINLADDAKVKVKIDGEEQVISYKDYKDILRKNATVTQRMQQFARSRDEFNVAVQQKLAELQQREAELAQKANQKDPLYETLLNALKGQVAPKERDPNEIVTLGDVQKERENLLKQFEDTRSRDKESFERMLQEAALKAQEAAQIQRERQSYLNGLQGLLNKDDYKMLGDIIPNLSASVMFHVQQMGPQNLDEALEMSEDFIKERAETFKKFTQSAQQKKDAEAAKQKMESTDGASPTILKTDGNPKKFVGKNGKLDWAAMQKDALARINAMN